MEKERLCCGSCHQLSRNLSASCWAIGCTRLGCFGGNICSFRPWFLPALQPSGPDPTFTSCLRSELCALLLTPGKAHAIRLSWSPCPFTLPQFHNYFQWTILIHPWLQNCRDRHRILFYSQTCFVNTKLHCGHSPGMQPYTHSTFSQSISRNPASLLLWDECVVSASLQKGSMDWQCAFGGQRGCSLCHLSF